MPPVIVALILLALAMVVFAIYGFITFLRHLASIGSNSGNEPPTPLPSQPKSGARSLSEDSIATCHLLNHLLSIKVIDQEQYETARGIIESRFKSTDHLPQRLLVTPKESPAKEVPESSAADPVSTAEQKKQATQKPATREPARKAPDGIVQPEIDKGITFQPTSTKTNEPKNPALVPEIATASSNVSKFIESVDRRRPAQSQSGVSSPVATQSVQATAESVAPWDRPDPTPLPPRRTFAEVMAGFMQEKNIRWGELASGILIVGSAVGLVVSLRDELRNTIPYFSALLFLLMTAAMHGAGSYTLRKWNLRNTSRGVLIIGMLLIPLNFLAGCLMDGAVGERRELTDPMYWVAISVALVAFSAMAWWSSKLLFRRGNLPMTIGIVGMGASTLLINRLDWIDSSSLARIVAALPIVVFFFVSTIYFYVGQFKRSFWPENITNRMFTHLGIAVFGLLSAGALIIFRSEERLYAIASLAPALAAVFCLIAWQGFVVWQGTPIENSAQKLTGLTLHLLGIILTGVAIAVAILNPSVLIATTLVAAIGVFSIAIQRKFVWLMPLGWVAVASSAMAVLHVVMGHFAWDEWTTYSEVASALLSGESGICLMVVGVAAGVVGHLIFPNLQTSPSPESQEAGTGTNHINQFTAGSLLLIGCLLAVAASLFNRFDVFDSMTASGLLAVSAIGLFAATISKKSKLSNQWVSGLSCFLLAGFLIHALIWNPTIANLASAWTFGTGAVWLLAIAIFGFVISATSAIFRLRIKTTEAAYRTEQGESLVGLTTEVKSGPGDPGQAYRESVARLNEYGMVATFANGLMTIGLFFVIWQQTGFASVIALTGIVSWWLLAWSQHAISKVTILLASCFTLSTAILPVVFLIEFAAETNWIPNITDPRHWLMQVMVICAWSVAWNVVNIFCQRKAKMGWLFDHRERIDHALTLIAALGLCCFVGVGLAELASEEMFIGGAFDLKITLSDYSTWIWVSLVACFAATTLIMFVRPTIVVGSWLILIWIVSWSMAAIPYEASICSASAIRWFVPIGGVVAVSLLGFRHRMVGFWDRVRSSLGLREPHRWSEKQTQFLVNQLLIGVVGVVLVISTVIISKFIISGQASFPVAEIRSWLNDMRKEVAYGVPIAITVAMFLMAAINEQRRWLALAGSSVFQYFVVLGVVLLFFASDPRVASSRFLNILQAISIGMTLYGFSWFWFRERIEPTAQTDNESRGWLARNGIDAIQLHTIINGVLITALAFLIMVRFFLWPNQPGDWVNTAGGPLGLIALILFTGLACTIWFQDLKQLKGSKSTAWLVCMLGIAIVSMVGSSVDHYTNNQAWLAYRTIMMGLVAVSALVSQVVGVRVWGGIQRRSGRQGFDILLPLLIPLGLAMAFAVRGALANPAWFAGYFLAIVILIALLLVMGCAIEQGWMGFVTIFTSAIGCWVFIEANPYGLLQGTNGVLVCLIVLTASSIGTLWILYYAYQRNLRHRTPMLSREFVAMPNWVALAGSLFVFIASLSFWHGDFQIIVKPIGLVTLGGIVALSITSLWNDRQRFRVISRYLNGFGLAIILVCAFTELGSVYRHVGILASLSAMVMGWGILWANRKSLTQTARKMGIVRLSAQKRMMSKWLRLLTMVAVGILIPMALVLILWTEPRPLRYIVAFSPILLAIALGCFADQKTWRPLQHGCLATATIGAIFMAWADMSPSLMLGSGLSFSVRTLLVLAGAMFVYGGLITRWLSEGDTWIQTFKEAAYTTSGLAMACLGIVIYQEINLFQAGIGCGLSTAEAIAVAAVVIGMIYGLISIAVRPEHDPFSLPLSGRKGYVYLSQIIGAVLVVHLYLSMPWLFNNGLVQKFWPYVAMALTFAGIGLASLLDKRKLEVLSDPMFRTSTILPVFVAVLIWFVDSSADSSIVMLTIGLVYLMVSYTHNSLLSGAAAVVSGNMALWMYYGRFPAFSFFEHPQLWLIPPAISALVAGQLLKKNMTAAQLGVLRYVCVAVIYISSTSEVFINGIGDQLWPPMVLALLSVAGIFLGIMMQVRAFLYLGSLFLLMALITMVSHAHQRFEHVWPWWAFGIGLGISILVLFGLFEKKRNEMMAITNRLKQWDL